MDSYCRALYFVSKKFMDKGREFYYVSITIVFSIVNTIGLCVICIIELSCKCDALIT